MRLESPVPLVAPLVLLLTLACGADQQPLPVSPSGPSMNDVRVVGRDAFAWSEPVWLGPVVNSTARDWRPRVSSDGLSLYFHSNRPGIGDFDIWVSRRAAVNCAWEAPMNLGAPINTARADGDPDFTPDGRLMFFSSFEGHGGAGRGDILVSHRADPSDDFTWQPPLNLGDDVNTAGHESNPSYVASEAGGTLYFDRGSSSADGDGDVYRVRVSRDGMPLGPAELVTVLSAPGPLAPHAPAVRADGREPGLLVR